MASTKLQTNLLGKAVLVDKPQPSYEVLTSIRESRARTYAETGGDEKAADEQVRRIWPKYRGTVVVVYLSFDMVKFVVQDEAGKLHDGIGVEKVEVVG